MTEEDEDYWVVKVSKDYFYAPIEEILEERQPASIGKIFLVDLLEERHPELFNRGQGRKSINQCVDHTLKHYGYVTISKRKKTYWRKDLVCR